MQYMTFLSVVLLNVILLLKIMTFYKYHSTIIFFSCVKFLTTFNFQVSGSFSLKCSELFLSNFFPLLPYTPTQRSYSNSSF